MLSTATLKTVRDNVLNRLGDADVQIWTEDEIESYVKDGYNEVCRLARIVWDMAILENLPYTGSHNHRWEESPAYFTAPVAAVVPVTGNRSLAVSAIPVRIQQGRFTVTAPWEYAYLPASYEPPPPANHTAVWERVDGYLTKNYIPAVVRLPDGYLETDRATNNWRRLAPKRSVELERMDPRCEVQAGAVEHYAQDKDGLRNLRKYRVPATPASEYATVGHYGILSAVIPDDAVTDGGMRIDEFARTPDGSISAADRSRMISVGFSLPGSHAAVTGNSFQGMPEWKDDAVVGSYGFPRNLPGHFPIGAPYGLARRVYNETNNFRLEHYRRGRSLDEYPFELPRAYVKYARHYAMYRALDKDGDGQDLKLAGHYKARYEAGLARIENRKGALYRNRVGIIGGSADSRVRHPGRPVPPPEWNTTEWRP